MKLRFTILLLCFTALLKAQTLTTLEYFFDTDPGYGNGIQVALSNTVSLDSSFNFNIAGLQQGIHTVSVRIKNSNNEWSHTIYSGNFFLWAGISGIPRIEMMEYFVDTAANAIAVPLTLTNILDTTVSINIPDNSSNLRTLGLQLKNQTGQKGNATLAQISLCSLYGPQSGNIKSEFGNTFSFYDTSRYNPSKNVMWKVDGVLKDSSRLFTYTFPVGEYGDKTIKQLTGSGCRLDSSQSIITLSGIEKFSPATAVIGNDFILNLFGGGFQSSMTVYLKRGDSVYYAYAKYPLNQGKQMSCYFDFHNRGPLSPATETYDLYVIFPDLHQELRSNAIILRNPSECEYNGFPRPLGCSGIPAVDNEPYFTVEKSGADNLRAGSWAQQSLTVTNRSSAVGYQIPVWLMMPADYDVSFYFNFHKFNAAQIDSLNVFPYTAMDTIINGHRFRYKLYGILVPVIEGGRSVILPFKIRTTNTQKDSCYYWVNKRMFGSPMKPFWSNCAEDIFNFIIGFAPGAGCLNSVYDFAYGTATAGVGTMGNFAYNLTNLALSCVPAEKVGLALSKIKEMQEGISGATTVIQQTVGNTALGLANGNPFVSCDTKNIGTPKIDPLTGVISYDPNYITGNTQYDSLNHFIDNFKSFHAKPFV